MKRGDIVTVAAKGHYSGKPRPALIVQSDLFAHLDSVTVCLFTSEDMDVPLYRKTIKPTARNGLKIPCRLMIDKLTTIPKTKLGKRIGRLDEDIMLEVERSLALFLGIG